jgi:hypothetical protein
MNLGKRFNDEFGLEPDLNAERTKFLLRIQNTLFDSIEKMKFSPESYEVVFKEMCIQLGQDFASIARGRSYAGPHTIPMLVRLTKSDFYTTLKLVEYLYAYYKDDALRECIAKQVVAVLDLSACDIGIHWKDGFFYKSGSGFLDSMLIDDPLGCLKTYPAVRDEYVRAVKDYFDNEPKEMAQKCFIVVENLTRGLLGNSLTLDKNRDALLSKLALSDEWKRIIGPYLIYIHGYSRHGDSVGKELPEREAEALLYITGILVRLIVRAMNNGA